MTNDERTCEVCGAGTVRRSARAGRRHEYKRGMELPIPATLELEECDHCGELYLDEMDATRLRDAMRGAYLEWQGAEVGELIEHIAAGNPGITQREIERALGVTSTYLSHLRAGRKEASETLITLLEEFALHPEDVRRKLDVRSWREVPRRSRAHYVGEEPRAETARQPQPALLRFKQLAPSEYVDSSGLTGDGDASRIVA